LHTGNEADASDALVSDFNFQFPESTAASQSQLPINPGAIPQSKPAVNNDVAHANLTFQQAQKLQNQSLTEQTRMNMMPGDLDPNVKQQLLKVPEAQFGGVLQNYMMSLRRGRAQDSAFNPNQQNLGQQNVPDFQQIAQQQQLRLQQQQQTFQMQRMHFEQQKKRFLQERQNMLDRASDNDADGWDSSNLEAQPMSHTTNDALQDYQMQ
jgi:hypothetical protein